MRPNMVIRSIRLSYDHIWLYTRTVPYCYSSLKHQVASARHLLFVTILSFCRYLCYCETPFSWEINSCTNCPITFTLIDHTTMLMITLITRKDTITPLGDTPRGISVTQNLDQRFEVSRFRLKFRVAIASKNINNEVQIHVKCLKLL